MLLVNLVQPDGNLRVLNYAALICCLKVEGEFILFLRNFRLNFFIVPQVLLENVLYVIRMSFANKHCEDGVTLDFFHCLNLFSQRLTLVLSEVSNTSVLSIAIASIDSQLGSLLFFSHFFSISSIFDILVPLLEFSDDF